MIRTFNYTGRARLRHKHLLIILRRDGAVPEFDAELRLDSYNIPKDAAVYVEAYRRTSYMRFGFGQVGAITPPSTAALSSSLTRTMCSLE